MPKTLVRWLAAAIACCLPLVHAAAAVDARASNLVSVEWLQKNIGNEDVLLLDASSARLYAAKHLPGAISVDLYT